MELVKAAPLLEYMDHVAAGYSALLSAALLSIPKVGEPASSFLKDYSDLFRSWTRYYHENRPSEFATEEVCSTPVATIIAGPIGAAVTVACYFDANKYRAAKFFEALLMVQRLSFAKRTGQLAPAHVDRSRDGFTSSKLPNIEVPLLDFLSIPSSIAKGLRQEIDDTRTTINLTVVAVGLAAAYLLLREQRGNPVGRLL